MCLWFWSGALPKAPDTIAETEDRAHEGFGPLMGDKRHE